jgi:hypothetical protein
MPMRTEFMNRPGKVRNGQIRRKQIRHRRSNRTRGTIDGKKFA